LSEDKINWTLDIIKKLQSQKIGDYARLDAIKHALENGRIIYESDKRYLKEKYKELQKLECKLIEEMKHITESKPSIEPTHNEPELNSDTVYCSKCENTITDDSNFCKNCGTKIKEEVENKFCGKCGTKMYNNNPCPKCSMQYTQNNNPNSNYMSNSS